MESGADAPLRPYLSLSRTLDKVRPGGVIAFITSKGTLDKENPNVRKYIAQRADLLGAIRLPNDTFKAAAGQRSHRTLSSSKSVTDWWILSPIGCIWPPTPMESG